MEKNVDQTKRLEGSEKIFAKYKKMYALPGVPLEIVEKNFKQYLKSVDEYKNKNDKKGRYGKEIKSYEQIMGGIKNATKLRCRGEVDECLNLARNILNNGNESEQLFFLNTLVQIKMRLLYDHNITIKVLNLFLDSARGVVLAKAIEYCKTVGIENFYSKKDSLLAKGDDLAIKQILKDSIFWEPHADNRLKIIKRYINYHNPAIRAVAMEKLYYLDESFDVQKHIKRLLTSEDSSIEEQLIIIKIKLLSIKQQGSDYEDYLRKYISLYEQYNAKLYEYYNPNGEYKATFPKTGGQIDTLGRKLRNKLIIRYLSEKAFAQWRKAYESAEVWKENGFDYIPIEPIYNFKRSLKYVDMMEVRAGVVGIGVVEYKAVGDKYTRFIDERIDKINKILKDKLKINFSGSATNHFADHNFALLWNKIEVSEGKYETDWSIPPRVYLIDWDHARSCTRVQQLFSRDR